jgi:hypothetical protein
MAAVLLAAMMVFASCSQPTDGDPGSPGSPGNPGPAVAPDSVSAQVLQALLVNSSTVYLDGNTTITSATGDTVRIPAGKTLKVIDGNLILKATAGALVFDASSGTLDLSDIGSGKIQGTSGDGTEVFIGSPALTSNASLINSTDLTAVPLVTALPEGTTGAIAVRNFAGELGDAAFDYAETNTVYVLDDITEPVGTDSDAVDLSGHQITCLGTVNVSGTGNLTLGTTSLINVLNILPGGDLTIVDGDEYAGTITNSGAAALTLTSANSPRIKVGASDLTIGGTPATLTLGKLDTTAGGALVLPANAISFTATAGGGKIKYAAAPASITVTSLAGLTVVGNITTAGAVTSTGGIEFTGNLSAASVTATTGDFVVGGNLTATGAITVSTGDLDVSGNVSGAGITVTAEDLKVGGNLTATGATTITVAGDLDVSGAITLSTVTTGALTVTAGDAAIGTLTGGGGANIITFGGDAEIGTFSFTTTATEIKATGEVTIANAVTGIASTKTLKISGDGVVKLPGTYTLFENAAATDIGVTGGTTGVSLGALASSTIPAGASLYIQGNLTLSGTAKLLLANATSRLVLLEGGKLEATVTTAGLDVTGGSAVTKVLLTVAHKDDPSTATKATVVTGTGTGVVTTDATGSALTTIQVGAIAFAITGTTAVSNQAGSTGTAAGSITAGEDTWIIITGTT